jgi:hypothetical protein
MSKYIRNGFLPFYRATVDRDWQKLGYWNNWQLALKFVPRDRLVGFATPEVDGTVAAPSSFDIRKLQITQSGVNVISTQTESTSNLVAVERIRNGNTLTYYSRDQQEISAALTKGCIYDISITDDDDNTFYSDIFLAIDESDLALYTESGQYLLTEDGQQILI